MIRFLFVCGTLIVGALLQLVLHHYLSLYDASPQVLLLLTIAHGFIFGPIMGEVLGFCWGLMSDASGIRLFGMNALMLALAGYVAGHLRRRVASERPTAQMVIALVATLYYMLATAGLHAMFDEAQGHFSILHFMLEAVYNVLFATVLFVFTERWVSLWHIPQEHI